MPHKSDKPATRKAAKEDTLREDDLEHEHEPALKDVISSPLSSASSYSSTSSYSAASSGDSSSSGTSISSAQLEMILAANQSTIASIISSLVPSGTVASAPPPPVTPRAHVKVPLWTEDESPSNYFSKLEKALTLNNVPRSQWGQNIHVQLTGKAQDALAQVPLVSIEDYDVIKATLLDALGDTPEFADRSWWSLGRKAGEDACAFYLRIRACGILRLQGLSTKEQILEKLVLSRFLSLLPADTYAHAADRRPKDGLEAAKIVQELEQRRAFTREKQGWRSNHHSHAGRREHSSSSGGSRPSSPKNHGSGQHGSPNNSSSSSGVKEVTSDQNASTSSSGNSRGRGDKHPRKPIICHNCGEPGHIRPQCPHKVRSVRSPDCETPAQSEVMFVPGWIAGCLTDNLKIDTGAERTLVRKDFVPPAAYTGDVVNLATWKGNDVSSHKLAKLTIKVGKVETTATVAVVEQLDCPALLGSDLGIPMTRQLVAAISAKLDAMDEVNVEVPMQFDEVNVEVPMQFDEVNVEVPMQFDEVKVEVPMQVVSQDVVVDHVMVTRAQAKKAAAEQQADDLATAASECQPTSLGELFQFDDTMFEYDSVPTQVKDLEVWPDDCMVDLPSLSMGQGDQCSLAKEQAEDVSLCKSLEAAGKGEQGFSFVGDVLVHEVDDGFVKVKRIVVPNSRREQVLRTAHTNLTAGHSGYKRTIARIARFFMWPGMWKQVREFVRACHGCQRAAKNDDAKAPLQPLPIVSEPFSKVAFDIVGPLPTTTKGNKYLLTMMCLFTKFPAAIPLRRVDNETVLNAMMEMFSTFGLPNEILTDQGSVFCSRLTRACCKLLHIDKLRTSPYHPQSNGSLERWHACLKSMLRKEGGNLKEWDVTLKYLLLAYRDTPHSVTGFSPFTLMYGREVKGPLDVLRTSWVEGDGDDCNVNEWLVGVKLKMSEMAELVSEREKVAKAKMKSYFDKGTKIKTFQVGDKVLVRRPALHGKFEKAWDGPFEVGKVVSPVTYLIKRPGHSSRSKCIHSNLLKKWVTPVETVHRVAFVLEEDGECQTPPRLKLAREDFVPSSEQNRALQAVLQSFQDVLNPRPGRTKLSTFCINTGDHVPVCGSHWRIPPKWVDEIRQQVDDLSDLGLIVPSVSPWASSVVLVKKKGGGVRICVDYRALNACTQPDPYLMPLIEDILDTLASAVFISKIDLNKGFHQIPVKPEDQEKTAFFTPWGKFQFIVMPFGVRNGPATFQRLMDRLLHQDLDIARVYIDDIAVFSSSWETHCRDIARVLGRLREAGLTANLSKCQFGQTSCEFLGHLVGKGKVSPAALKVKAVQDFVFPKTKRQVRQFLGLTGYYRRFIPKYSEHAYHLTEATRKLAPDRVKQTDALSCEFSYLKDRLCAMPMLTLPVPSDCFVLQTDASGLGLGAVLSVHRGEEELPVAFHSRKLLPREQKYSASELECLAVVDAVRHFGSYLIPQSFVVETDHKALTYLMTANHHNGRLARWALLLQPYTFSIRYRPGCQHINADALSRMFFEDPPSRMPDAPAAYEDPSSPSSTMTIGQPKRGGDVMESPQPAAAP